MSCEGGVGGGASAGGGGGGMVESSLTKYLDFARFIGSAEGLAEAFRTLANQPSETNKKRTPNETLNY